PPPGPPLAIFAVAGGVPRCAVRRPEQGFTSGSRAGLRLHPGVRQGAVRRRRGEWGQPHTLSWRAAWAADAEWLSGKSRNRLAPALTEASSWMSVFRALATAASARRSIGPEHQRSSSLARPLWRLRSPQAGTTGVFCFGVFASTDRSILRCACTK